MTLHRDTHDQKPSPMPYHRYRAFPPIDLPDRTWPTATITQAPRWLHRLRAFWVEHRV